MKLQEILNQKQMDIIMKAQPTGGSDIPDPILDAKKNQLKTIARQLEATSKQLAQQAKLGRQNPQLEARVAALKEKMNKIKSTMLDSLDVKKDN